MKKRIIFFAFLIFILLFLTLLVTFRWIQAKQSVNAEWINFSDPAPVLTQTARLEIIPLYEALKSDESFHSGHGVSYLVRTDSATVLLDVGHNPDDLAISPYMQNMQSLGISWDEVYRIIISHPHPDHIGGMKAWLQRTVGFGQLPGGLVERLVFVPLTSNLKGAVHATVPTLIAPDIATTGVIAYLESWPFSLFSPMGGEQALVVHLDGEGLVLITGCGHPGLERLVTRAESLYGAPVIGVVGGLHLTNASEDMLQPQIQFLKSRPIRFVALSAHDSGPAALAGFDRAFPGVFSTLSVGEKLVFHGVEK